MFQALEKSICNDRITVYLDRAAANLVKGIPTSDK